MIARTIDMLIKYHGMFFDGVKITLFMAAVTVFFGAIFGSVLCLMRMSKGIQVGKIEVAPLRWVAATYVEVVRGTPLLLQLFLMFFVIPDVIGLDLSKLTCAIVALSLNSAAYVAELIRAGIQAVDKGQAEAARSLGLSSVQTMKEIIMPQAIKNILPALGNEFVSIVKESSLGSTFFVGEIMTVRSLLTGALYLTMEPLLIAGLLYFAITFTLTKVINVFERRLSRGD